MTVYVLISHADTSHSENGYFNVEGTVKPVLSSHKKDIFWLFGQVVAYCCMKVVQEAPTVALCATLT